MAPEPGAAGEAPARGPERPDPTGRREAADSPPGLRAQIGAVRDAVLRLLRAHIALARAELDQVLDEVKRIAALVGVAIGALGLLAIFFPIGLFLFLGEWLFGSIGWGLLHGSLFLIGVAVSAGCATLGVTGGQLGRRFLLAVVIGAVIGIIFGLDQPNVAWTRIGEALLGGLDPAVRPLVVGTIAVAIAVGILGLLLGGLLGGGGAALGGLLVGAVLGAILGAFSAITFGVQAGAAVGVTVALLGWSIFEAVGLARTGVDANALRARFWPSITLETGKQTIEWIRSQTPLGPKS